MHFWHGENVVAALQSGRSTQLDSEHYGSNEHRTEGLACPVYTHRCQGLTPPALVHALSRNPDHRYQSQFRLANFGH